MSSRIYINPVPTPMDEELPKWGPPPEGPTYSSEGEGLEELARTGRVPVGMVTHMTQENGTWTVLYWVPKALVSVKSEIARHNKVIERAQAKIKALRESCPHPGAVKTHKANTGNYDPSSDCYWTEFQCPECGKFWTVEGSV